MKKSKPTKSNDLNKILRQISRDIELERNDGKWVAMNRTYKDKKKYNRKDIKEELRKDLSSIFFSYRTSINLVFFGFCKTFGSVTDRMPFSTLAEILSLSASSGRV